jgi:hypothetical protein
VTPPFQLIARVIGLRSDCAGGRAGHQEALAEIVVQAGRNHYDMLQAELLPVAGNA